MDAEERAAWETMKAWMEVRNTHLLGSKEWEHANQEYKKAEAEYYRIRK
jgi:hypothetical protein